MKDENTNGKLGRVCVFTGSSPGSRPGYIAAARRLGETLIARSVGLVYGGASVGLMGELARAVETAGGEVIGVIPRALVAKEVAFRELRDLRMVETMHERKALLADLCDAFIAMPGGFGTLEEFFEALTWEQLGVHQKPCGILNVEGYYDRLLEFLDFAVAERFIKDAHRSMIIVESDPERLIDRLQSEKPTAIDKWLDRDKL